MFISTKTLPYVYKCVNSNGDFYIGYRCANKVPSSDDLGYFYFTSADYIKSNFSDFITIILAEFFTGEAALEFEQKLIEENWLNPSLLNRNKGNVKFKCPKGIPQSFDHIKKRIEKMKQTKSQITYIPWNKGLKGDHRLKQSKETIEKKRRYMLENNPFKGKRHSEETKQKLREFHLGSNVTEETKKKISEKTKNVPKSYKTRKAMALAYKNEIKTPFGVFSSIFEFVELYKFERQVIYDIFRRLDKPVKSLKFIKRHNFPEEWLGKTYREVGWGR